jgi:hypothetical protein
VGRDGVPTSHLHRRHNPPLPSTAAAAGSARLALQLARARLYRWTPLLSFCPLPAAAAARSLRWMHHGRILLLPSRLVRAREVRKPRVARQGAATCAQPQLQLALYHSTSGYPSRCKLWGLEKLASTTGVQSSNECAVAVLALRCGSERRHCQCHGGTVLSTASVRVQRLDRLPVRVLVPVGTLACLC